MWWWWWWWWFQLPMIFLSGHSKNQLGRDWWQLQWELLRDRQRWRWHRRFHVESQGHRTTRLGGEGLRAGDRDGSCPSEEEGLAVSRRFSCDGGLADHGFSWYKQHQHINFLVGGLEHLDYFSIYWECHHPNCYSLHHFSEGWRAQPPTNGSWRFSRSRRSGGTSALPALLRFAEKINDWSCAK